MDTGSPPTSTGRDTPPLRKVASGFLIYHAYTGKNPKPTKRRSRSMARMAAKARCNYYPLPDREAELIRSCLTFPDEPFSALDPCAGEGRAMAVVSASSQAVRY